MIGCVAWGHDGLEKIQMNAFTVYGQFDILEIHIVSRIIGSSQCDIVDIVGQST